MNRRFDMSNSNFLVTVKNAVIKTIFSPSKWPTPFLILVTLACSTVWWWCNPTEVEPVFSFFGVIAAISALWFDPLIQREATRAEVIEGIKYELASNDAILAIWTDDEFDEKEVAVFIRMMSSSLERALILGTFSAEGDEKHRDAVIVARALISSANAEVSGSVFNDADDLAGHQSAVDADGECRS